MEEFGIFRVLKCTLIDAIGGQISCLMGSSRLKVKGRPVLGVKSKYIHVGHRREFHASIRTHVHAKYPGVLDRTGVCFHLNGAHIEEIRKLKPVKRPE